MISVQLLFALKHSEPSFEKISVLFEQVRRFGGSLVIAAQGYAGLGPTDYANRILDASNTYILHSGSDPFPVAKRAGKRLCVETAWSEDDQQAGDARKQTHSHWEWNVPENAVMQQSKGQAYWINRGRAQQVFTARVPLTSEQVHDAWTFICEQKAEQQAQHASIKRQPVITTDK